MKESNEWIAFLMVNEMKKFDVQAIRRQFPILEKKINSHPLVYFDNAATSQKPKQVLQAIQNYYTLSNANIHRSIHTLGEEATEQYENSRKNTADFVSASPEEVIFTRNATESMNVIAQALKHALKAGDEIVLTEAEHHSNLIPWQEIAREKKAKLKFAKINSNFEFDLHQFKDLISEKTKIVALHHASNVTGAFLPVEEISKTARKVGAKVVVDVAQSIPHQKIDFRDLGADAIAFSGHKMLAPTGIGALVVRKEFLDSLSPVLFGGGMIREVGLNSATWTSAPAKFEAGTPNIEGAIGMASAIDFLNEIGMKNIEAYEKELSGHFLDAMKNVQNFNLLGPDHTNRTATFSFNLGDVHPHDVAEVLNKTGIAIRAGHHCAMPLMTAFGMPATCRASLSFYNTIQEIDFFAKELKKVERVFA